MLHFLSVIKKFLFKKELKALEKTNKDMVQFLLDNVQETKGAKCFIDRKAWKQFKERYVNDQLD